MSAEPPSKVMNYPVLSVRLLL